MGSSRTPLIALIIFAIVAPFFFCPRRSRLLVVLGLTVCIVSFLSSPLSEILSKRVVQAYVEMNQATRTVGDQSSSVGMRVQMWIITSEIIRDNWVVGTGSGSFKNRFAEVATSYPDWIAKVSDDPHQQYLLIWAEQGIISLVPFLAILVSVFRNSIRVLRQNTEPVYLQEIISLILILVYFTCSSLVNGHFGSFVEGRISWIIVAFLVVISCRNDIGCGSRTRKRTYE